MSDDFASEISSAVDNGGQATNDAPVTNNVTQQPSQRTHEVTEPDTAAAKATEDSVLEILGDSDYEKAEKAEKAAAAEKQKTDAAAKAAEEKVNAQTTDADNKATDGTEKKDGQQKEIKDFDEKTPYLDRFLKQDSEGNLVAADGSIIVPRGTARQWYERVKKEGRDAREHATKLAITNQQLAGKFKELYDAYSKVSQGSNRSLEALKTDAGMNDNELNSAIEIMKQYKKDPVTAIKSLLTQAQMSGIDLSKISANGFIDAGTVQSIINRAIEEKIAPLSRSAEQEAQSREIAKQVNDFWQEFPDLQPHEDVIAEAKRRAPEMSLREIGLRYRLFLQQQKQNTAQEEPPAQPQQPSMRRQPPAQQQPRQPLQRVVTPPPTQADYAKMSFQEIAQSILRESEQQ